MKGKRAAPPKFQTLKVRAATRAKLDALLACVSEFGWQAVKAHRRDAPSLADVVDAAVDALESQRVRLKP